MDGTLDFDSFDLGDAFNPNNVTQTASNFIKLKENTFLGMPKIRVWSIFTFSMP